MGVDKGISMAFSDDEKQHILNLLVRLDEKADRNKEDMSEVKERTAKLEATFDQHMKQDEKMQDELSKYNTHLTEYNAELKVHIAGVQELRRANDLSERQQAEKMAALAKRIDDVEAPRLFWQKFKKDIIDLSKLIAAGATIAGLIKWLFPHIF